MFNFFKTKSEEVVELKLPIAQIKEKANILFIDDHQVDLIETLQLEGWHVEYWSDVRSLNDLESGKFDIIFLDIGGVGKDYSPLEEGFGILSRVKKINPSVLIVAYSGQSFDASKSQFWSKADASLSKSSGAIEAIELLESLLAKKYNSKVLWDDFLDLLKQQNVSEKNVNEIQKIIFGSRDSDSVSKLKSALSLISLGASTSNSLISIGEKIILIVKHFK